MKRVTATRRAESPRKWPSVSAFQRADGRQGSKKVDDRALHAGLRFARTNNGGGNEISDPRHFIWRGAGTTGTKTTTRPVQARNLAYAAERLSGAVRTECRSCAVRKASLFALAPAVSTPFRTRPMRGAHSGVCAAISIDGGRVTKAARRSAD